MKREAALDRTDRTSGVFGNAALTAWAAVALLILLAVEGATLLRLRLLLAPHIFVGLLLLPPIGLKLASVGYRFVRYYSGDPRYRAAGPPHLLARLLGPLVVLSTAGLFGSGIGLLAVGPVNDSVWRRLHILFFLGWFCLMTLHVLIHLLRVPTLTLLDLKRNAGSTGRAGLAGSLTRQSLVAGSVILGVVIALTFMPSANPWLQR